MYTDMISCQLQRIRCRNSCPCNPYKFCRNGQRRYIETNSTRTELKCDPIEVSIPGQEILYVALGNWTLDDYRVYHRRKWRRTRRRKVRRN